MKTNFAVLALLMSNCFVEATKVNHYDSIKPVMMSQIES